MKAEGSRKPVSAEERGDFHFSFFICHCTDGVNPERSSDER